MEFVLAVLMILLLTFPWESRVSRKLRKANDLLAPSHCGYHMMFDNRDYAAHHWYCTFCGAIKPCDYRICCGGDRE